MMPPVGFVGKFSAMILVFGVMAFSTSAAMRAKLFSSRVFTTTGTP